MKKDLIIPVILGVAIIGALVALVNKNSSPRIYTYGAANNDQISLTTDPSPLRLGPANFIINVQDEKGNPVDGASVFFDLNMTTMNMGTQQGAAIAQGDGQYVATGRLTMPGLWRVATKVTRPDGKVLKQNFNVNVR
jgi:nitrogen fixation protein FixH